jgi:hypothetical protein
LPPVFMTAYIDTSKNHCAALVNNTARILADEFPPSPRF